MKLAVGLLAVLVALYALHRLCVWAEERGWIHYRKGRGDASSLGNALLEVHRLIEPSKGHVVEEQAKEVRVSQEAGEP